MEKLAIFGGEKIAKDDEMKFNWPRITHNTEKVVMEQLHKTISIYDNSGIFEEFEKKFADYHNKKYALLSNSGTSAIFSMFESIDLRNGDEVLCPVYTFHATVSPMMYFGAKPIFCDSDNEGNISFDSIKNKYTNNTKAVIVTHMWGVPIKDIEKIADFCREKHIYLLEDYSHAHGAEIYGKKVGTFGDIAAWSLQGQKTVTGGEGGIILTDDKKLFNRALLQGHYNKRPKNEIDKSENLYKYYLTGMGLKLRAHPLAIAIADEQFGHLNDFLKTRNEYAIRITEALKKYPFLKTPSIESDSIKSWYAYGLQYIEKNAYNVTKEEFVNTLHAEGLIEVDIPSSTGLLNTLPLFIEPNKLLGRLYPNNLPLQNDFYVAERYVEQFIKIPIWTFPDESNIIDKYIAGFKKVCDYILKNKGI